MRQVLIKRPEAQELFPEFFLRFLLGEAPEDKQHAEAFQRFLTENQLTGALEAVAAKKSQSHKDTKAQGHKVTRHKVTRSQGHRVTKAQDV